MTRRIWKPGESGNLAGRPKGIKNKVSLLREALISPVEAREVVAKLVESATAGDTQAAGILMDRLWPRLRPSSPAIAFPLPDADLAAQAEAVMRECADGRIPVAEASAILSSLSAVARIHETSEFERRLKALESRGFKKEGR
jgi:hypothetical protein